MKRTPLTETLKRKLAVIASVDPRTVKAAYEGREIRGLAGDRVRAAFQAAGLVPTAVKR